MTLCEKRGQLENHVPEVTSYPALRRFDDLLLSFKDGLNVIAEPTNAGKTAVVDTLRLFLERFYSDLPYSQCRISVCIQLSGSCQATREWRCTKILECTLLSCVAMP